MALPGLPDLPHVTAYRTIVRALQNHPYLKAAVKTWRVWSGDTDDAAPPTTDQAPWVRLTPGGEDGSWFTENQHRVPLVIHVEMFTEGLNSDDPMNLWGAMAMAIFPGDGTVAGALGGITGVIPAPQLAAPSFPVVNDPANPTGLLTTGLIRIPVLLTTAL